MLPDARWIGGIIILIGLLALVFDVSVDRGRIDVGGARSLGKRVKAMFPQLMMLVGALLFMFGAYFYIEQKRSTTNASPSITDGEPTPRPSVARPKPFTPPAGEPSDWTNRLASYSGDDLQRLDTASYEIFSIISEQAVPLIRRAKHLNHNFEMKMAKGNAVVVDELDEIERGITKVVQTLHDMTYARYNYYRDELREITAEGALSQFRQALHKYRDVLKALPDQPARNLLDLMELQRESFDAAVEDAAKWAAETKARVKAVRTAIKSQQEAKQ